MSKGWSCCRRKVLEFDEFLKIEGCTVGKHKFVAPPAPTTVDYRYDYYQSVPKVILSIYCKKANKEKTNIRFEKDAIHLYVVGPDSQVFEKTLKLYERIKPDESSFVVMSTKVEVRLIKEESVQWDTLEM
eukprot:TRINITY_DN4443_c0_g1_i2.p1 TRINITY_DN4443_c0_g1~~TRINITY_DN4443_c0_g1_i2.p1  ORF type:complete len:130 (-),score=22.05 TRINITY_DN4443_c0_g1_i2:8-397(-)